MKRWLRPALVAAMTALGCTLPHAAVSQSVPSYTFTDLGTLGGNSTVAYSVNNAGQVAGTAVQADGRARAFRWQNGVLTNLGVLKGHTYSQGRAINAAGSVAGFGGGSPPRALLWSSNGVQDIGGGSFQTEAYGINDAGNLAGIGYPRTGHRAYLWRLASGKYTGTALGTLASQGWAINNNGQVAGTLNGSNPGQPFLWSPSVPNGSSGNLVGLGVLPGHLSATAAAINDGGAVVGSSDSGSRDAGGRILFHAFLSLPGAAYGLPAGLNDLHDGASGWQGSLAYGINAPSAGSGEPLRVVGSARRETREGRAFVWDSTSNTMQDLNLLTAAPAGWVLTSAWDVNDKGQIVGEATYNGTTRAFLLSPNTP